MRDSSIKDAKRDQRRDRYRIERFTAITNRRKRGVKKYAPGAVDIINHNHRSGSLPRSVAPATSDELPPACVTTATFQYDIDTNQQTRALIGGHHRASAHREINACLRDRYIKAHHIRR